MKEIKYILLISFVVATFLYLFFLFDKPNLPGSEDEYVHDNGFIFINTSKDVKYMGTETCKSCHKTSHGNFTNTEMYRSFGKLDSTNIIETYPHKKPVYDPGTGYYYEMIRMDNKFFQREFRLDKGGNLVYERLVEAQYAIGSGNSLRMYFYNENGMLYQLPLTWYTFRQTWDLSPGFKETGNLRFNRFATKKCITCHNSYMHELESATDRFEEPFIVGIGCERCHGPGEIHVKEMNADTNYKLPEKYLSIVNPAKLSQERMVSICMQCHLQGKAWALNEEDSWFDFRPGQLLNSNRSVYFPQQTSKEHVEVGDSPHRLSLSSCFKKSEGKLTCITCHNPHYSITSFKIDHYNEKCLGCHPINTFSSNTQYTHNSKDNCISCHMNQTGKENTLHGVSLTDHWIRVDAYKTKIDWTALRQPVNLNPLQLVPDIELNDANKYIRKGTGYLDYYFEYDRRSSYLDSATYYLRKDAEALSKSSMANYNMGEVFMEKNDFTQAIEYYKHAVKLDTEYANAFFKLGKAYKMFGDYNSAISYFRNSVKLKPDEPPYLENLGISLIETGRIEEGINILKKAVSIDGYNAKTFYTLGYAYAIDLQQPGEALEYFKKAVSLDPLIENGFLNLGNTYTLLENFDEALEAYKKEIEFNSTSASAYVNSGRVYQLLGDIPTAKLFYKKALEIEPGLTIAKKFLDEL